jgi:hypothetical protein
VPRATENALNAQARIEGTQAIITAEATQNGQPATNASISATVIGDDGASEPAALQQVGPGQFQITLPSPQRGSYLVQLSAQANGQAIGQQLVGLVVPYSPEYRQGQSNPALLDAVASTTGGARIKEPAAAFEHDLATVRRAQEISLPLLLLATLLLPLDIAVRRLSLGRRDWRDAHAWVAARAGRTTSSTPAAPSPAMRDLQRAKARAQVRTSRSTAPASEVSEQPAQPAAASVTRRAASVVERPSAAETEQAAQAPQASNATPAAPAADDPLARLRAAKERARRR